MSDNNLCGMGIDRTRVSRTLGAADFKFGYTFVAKWVVKKTGITRFGYTELLITAWESDFELWYKSKEGTWCFARVASSDDIKESRKCFQTMEEMKHFYECLMIAA